MPTHRPDTPAVSAARIAFYRRLMDAEETLERLRVERGISIPDFESALRVDPETGQDEAEDLMRLARAVAALGGRLELRALFAEESVTLMTEPDPKAPGSDT